MGATFFKYDRNGKEIDYISKKLIINHKDSKLFDNRGLHSNVVSNLEWRTASQNIQLIHTNKSIKMINLDDGTCAWFRCAKDCYKLFDLIDYGSMSIVASSGTKSQYLIPTFNGIHVRYCTIDEYLNNWKNSQDIRLKFSSKRTEIEVSNVNGHDHKPVIYKSIQSCFNDCIGIKVFDKTLHFFKNILTKNEKELKTNPFSYEIEGSGGKCMLKVTRNDGLISRKKILINNHKVEDEYNEFVDASHIGNAN